jgi:hypothetical protein
MSEYLQSGHHPDADRICAFVEHSLPTHEQEQMFNHLAVCPECRAVVALSLPPLDESAKPLPSRVRTPRWSWWTVAWPAAAAFAGIAVLVFYIHRTAIAPSAPASTEIASAHPPAPPVFQVQSPTPPANKPLRGSPAESAGGTGAAAAVAGLERSQDAAPVMTPQRITVLPMQGRNVAALDKVTEEPTDLPAASPGQNARLGAADGGGAQGGTAGGLAMAQPARAVGALQNAASTEPAPAATAQAAAPAAMASLARSSETIAVASAAAPIETVSADMASTAIAMDEPQVTSLMRPLPSRLAVLSVAAQARRIVAIDTQNSVFLSEDAGKHWKAIHPQWPGRAVRTSLVAFPTGSPASYSQLKAAGAGAPLAANAVSQQDVNGALLARSRSLAGASGSSLTGTVTDPTGAVIPGATVAVIDSATHTARIVTSDQAGHYFVGGLASGTYQLEAQARGFNKQTIADVVVAANSQNRTNLSLRIGLSTQAVTVTSAPPETLALDAKTEESSVADKKKAKPVAPSQPPSVFEIVTDSGDRWTSADGLTWKHK